MNEIEAIEALKELNENYFSDDFDEANEAIILAISALEKQIIKKPTTNEDKDEWICPNCESDLMGCYGELDKDPEYCLFCGQKLDWSVEE